MSLPKGFKRLEYIQSSGTQYIDSGFIPNQDTRVVCKAQYTDTSGSEALLGSRYSTSKDRYDFVMTGGVFYSVYNNNTGMTTATATASVMVIDKNKNITSIDGVVFSTQTYASFQCPGNLLLFANNTNNTPGLQASATIYSCQIYDNGTLIRDYVPCKNASGAVGLWDAANEVFYGNAGTGTFTAGPVVPEIVDENEITELEYIQSSGTQYVNTVFFPSESSRISFDFQSTGSTSDSIKAMFGARLNNDTKCFDMFVLPTTAYPQYGANAYNAKPISANILQRTVYDMNRNTATVNGVSVSFAAETFETGFPVYLFTINDNGIADARPISGKLYACQIYDNGLLVRDYIPAKLSNGETGLYEFVFHEFYRNAGTGEFIAGPETVTTPKAPANFRVESEADTLVTLAWDASDKAVGYRLYRSVQLLADTTETFASVTVEPFAGAVFTVTAYNENGEGAGAELTYFNAPDDPILFLVTDRTRQDVAEQNPKGCYAASDLNRVGFAVEYLAGRLKDSGVSVTVSPVLTWTDADWATPTTMKGYLADVQTMRGALKLASTTPEVPEDMERLTYTEANEIEAILLALDTHIKQMLMTVDAGWAIGLAYTGFYAKEAY